MVLGYHIVLGMYGFWLPNDPRGSWSRFVWSEALRKHGPATKVSTRQSVAAQPHDVARRLAAKRDLLFPPVVLTGQQALAIARGFAQAVEITGAKVWACSILPEHTHLVVDRFDGTIEQFVAEAKQRATLRSTPKVFIRWPTDSYQTAADRPPGLRGSGKCFCTTRLTCGMRSATQNATPRKKANGASTGRS